MQGRLNDDVVLWRRKNLSTLREVENTNEYGSRDHMILQVDGSRNHVTMHVGAVTTLKKIYAIRLRYLANTADLLNFSQIKG